MKLENYDEVVEIVSEIKQLKAIEINLKTANLVKLYDNYDEEDDREPICVLDIINLSMKPGLPYQRALHNITVEYINNLLKETANQINELEKELEGM